MKKDELMKAADRLAVAYRAWIEANADYNTLLAPTPNECRYSISWTQGTSYNAMPNRKRR